MHFFTEVDFICLVVIVAVVAVFFCFVLCWWCLVCWLVLLLFFSVLFSSVFSHARNCWLKASRLVLDF